MRKEGKYAISSRDLGLSRFGACDIYSLESLGGESCKSIDGGAQTRGFVDGLKSQVYWMRKRIQKSRSR